MIENFFCCIIFSCLFTYLFIFNGLGLKLMNHLMFFKGCDYSFIFLFILNGIVMWILVYYCVCDFNIRFVRS